MDIKQRTAIEKLIRTYSDPKILKKATKTPSMPFMRNLMSWQRKLIENSTRKEALFCGRRAGKTHALVNALNYYALKYPNSLCVYIAPTLRDAKDIIWQDLKDSIEYHKLPAKINNSDASVLFDNKSSIKLRGCQNRREAEKFRGKKYRVVIIDEAAMFPSYIRYLIEEAIGPALEDLEGTLYLSSTPNCLCTGYFYDITTDPKSSWHITHKTVLDNSKFPLWAGKKNWKTLAKNWFEKYKSENKWKDDNPILLREWLSKWIKDEQSLVLPLTDDNIYTSLPNEQMEYAIGVDLGFIDEFAISVLAHHKYDQTIYIQDSFKQSETLTKDKILILSKYIDKYNPSIVVADTGGAGKQFLEDFNAETKLNICAAHKTKRFEYVDLFADAFRTNKIKINAKLSTEIEELRLLQWKDKAKCEMSGNDHFFDATLYIWRELLGRYTTNKPTNEAPTLEQIENNIHTYIIQQLEEEQFEDSFYY